MRLPPYSNYKPSGVAWLGDVPEHWEVDRVKWTTTGTINGTWGEEPNGVDDVICVRVADFDRERFLVVEEPPTVRAVDEAQRSGRLLQKGDLLIEKSGGGEKQLVGCVVYFDHDFAAVCSNFVARMPTSPRHCARFWSYAHAALYAGRLNYSSIKQTTGIQNLDSSAYLNTRVGLPTEAEQRAIADFLDHETAKIDTLVAKKRTLIERLKEKRTALISRTVTRGLPPDSAGAAGLDPHPKLKASGIDWLGDVPEHWEVLPLRRSVAFLTDYEANGSFADTKENVTVDSGEPYAWYVRATDLEQRRVGLTDGNRFCDESSYKWLKKTALYGGELLVAKRGEIGKVYVMPRVIRKATLAPNLYLIRLNRRLAPRYGWYWFSVDPGNAELVLANKSTTIGALYKDDVKSCKVLVPPVAEQVVMTEFLDRETAKIDRMVAKVDTAIERLQEYRSALITAAVTGKIDVRRTAA